MYQGALVKVLSIYENNVSIQLSNAFFGQFYMEMNAFANDVFGYEQMLESNEKGKKREMIKKILGKFKMNGASLEKFKGNKNIHKIKLEFEFLDLFCLFLIFFRSTPHNNSFQL